MSDSQQFQFETLNWEKFRQTLPFTLVSVAARCGQVRASVAALIERNLEKGNPTTFSYNDEFPVTVSSVEELDALNLRFALEADVAVVELVKARLAAAHPARDISVWNDCTAAICTHFRKKLEEAKKPDPEPEPLRSAG